MVTSRRFVCPPAFQAARSAWYAFRTGPRGQEPHPRDALLALNELRRDYEHMFRQVVARGVEDGSLRDVDVSLATRTLLTSLNAVDVWYRKIDGQSEDEVRELARRVVDLVIGGIAAR